MKFEVELVRRYECGCEVYKALVNYPKWTHPYDKLLRPCGKHLEGYVLE